MVKSSRAFPFAIHHHILTTLQSWSMLLFTGRAIYTYIKASKMKIPKQKSSMTCPLEKVAFLHKSKYTRYYSYVSTIV